MIKSNIGKMIDHYQNTKIHEQTKIREILQQAALLGLERHGFFEKAAFYRDLLSRYQSLEIIG